MRILIVDDDPNNIKSAQDQTALFEEAGHTVTIIDNFQVAFDLIDESFGLTDKPFDFDIGLFDLWMPIGDWTRSVFTPPSSWNPVYKGVKPEQLPAGLVFVLKFLQQNKKVGIVTDSDHHIDWICNMLDLVSIYKQSSIPQNVYYFEARGFRIPNDDRSVNIKDWFAVFNRIFLDENPNPRL